MCFTSSLHPHHLSFPLSPINKILHSPGYMEVTDRVRQFFHWLIYISFCSNTGFSLLLYALTHTGDLVAILWHQTYALFFFPFPTALFLLQSSCLWSSDELLLKKRKKKTRKMIREAKQGHLQFTSQWKQRRGETERNIERGDHERREVVQLRTKRGSIFLKKCCRFHYLKVKPILDVQ